MENTLLIAVKSKEENPSTSSTASPYKPYSTTIRLPSFFNLSFTEPIKEYDQMNNMLNEFPFLMLTWKRLSLALGESKINVQKKKVSIESFKNFTAMHYSTILTFFNSLVENMKFRLNSPPKPPKPFPSEVILVASLGIYHANNLALKSLFEEIKESELILSYLSAIKTFHEFFFAIAQFRCNSVIDELSLSILRSSITTILSKLNPTLKYDSANIAGILYYLIQRLGIVAVFSKFNKEVLELFEELFMLMPSLEGVFNSLYEPEEEWLHSENKSCLISFGCKLFSMNNKADEDVNLNLRYLVIYTYYKVLKVTAPKNDRMSKIMTTMLHKSKANFDSLKDTKDMLIHLNETLYLLKTFVLMLFYFPGEEDSIQQKHDTLRNTIISCLLFSRRTSCKYLIGNFFKILLTYKKLNENDKKETFNMITVTNFVNTLAMEIIEKSLVTGNEPYIYLYRIHFLNFLLLWDVSVLKSKHMKYCNEIRKYLEDFGENELNLKVQELSLEVYIRLAKIDFRPIIEPSITFIYENFTNPRKLDKGCYVIVCLLLRKTVSGNEYKEILNGTSKTLVEVKGLLQDSSEVKAFIENKGMSVLFFVYKNIAHRFKQLKQELDAYNEPENIYEDVTKSITSDCAIESSDEFTKYRKLIQDIESLICLLHHSETIAKSFLEYSELDNDFYTKILPNDFGQSMILKLIKILSSHLRTLKSSRLIDKFTSFTTNLFNVLNSIYLDFEQEKILAVRFIEALENILLGNVNYVFTFRIIWQMRFVRYTIRKEYS